MMAIRMQVHAKFSVLGCTGAPKRNSVLGRACRCASPHGYTVRSNYVDSSFVREASPFPAQLKCKSVPDRRRRGIYVFAGTACPGEKVLVVGATGGVGQLVTAKLVEKGYQVRVAVRNKEKAIGLFGEAVEAVVADTRSPEGLHTLFEGVDAVACCTGTTAFPSKRWDGNNGPEQTDFVGTKNLVAAASACGLKRFVLVTSVGVERYNSFPFVILNAFGVLKFKKMAEEALQSSGIPYTIIRPGRLTDGPYTSYDLNTLLKATSGTRQDVALSPKDDLNGEASRIAVAECVTQTLASATAERMVMSISSADGNGPGQDAAAWEKLFEGVLQKS